MCLVEASEPCATGAVPNLCWNPRPFLRVLPARRLPRDQFPGPIQDIGVLSVQRRRHRCARQTPAHLGCPSRTRMSRSFAGSPVTVKDYPAGRAGGAGRTARHGMLHGDRGFLRPFENPVRRQTGDLSIHIPGEIPDLMSLFLHVMDHDLSTLTACGSVSSTTKSCASSIAASRTSRRCSGANVDRRRHVPGTDRQCRAASGAVAVCACDDGAARTVTGDRPS